MSGQMQDRAQATRQALLDAAVAAFDDGGYADTGLAYIVRMSNLSKGAFYYHFDSKEALAIGILEEMDRRTREAVIAAFPEMSLASLIRSCFAVRRLMNVDRTVRVGRMLLQADRQISAAGAKINSEQARMFIEGLAAPVLTAGELPTGVEPADLAEALWLGVVGHYAASEADGDDGYERLVRLWKVMLHLMVPPGDVARYHLVVDDAARDYAETGR